MDKLFQIAKSVCLNANNHILQFLLKNKPRINELKEKVHPKYNFDLEIHSFIYDKLSPTNIQIISEESYNYENLDSTFWLVDPVDGSRDLVKNKNSTINISLIQDGYPVFGVINDIFSRKQFSGISNTSNYFCLKSGEIISNSKTCLITSKLHKNKDDRKFILKNKFKKTKSISSSRKFIEIANASSDLYSRFEGSSAWDTSAGQAIIEAHGGLVLSLYTKKRLKYESKSRLRNPPFIALRKNLRLNSFNEKTLKITLNEINNFSSRKRN